MSNVADLKTALQTAAADIVNTIDRLDCLTTIDDWYNCRLAAAALQGAQLQSYTINGRTITRAQAMQSASQERQLYQRIREYLYGTGAVLADARGSES
jgi:hypothetical protein